MVSAPAMVAVDALATQGSAAIAGGIPATVVPGRKYAICFDVGGTNIRCSLVDVETLQIIDFMKRRTSSNAMGSEVSPDDDGVRAAE